MSYKLTTKRLTQPIGNAQVDGSLLDPNRLKALFVPSMGGGVNIAPGKVERSPAYAMSSNLGIAAKKPGMGYEFTLGSSQNLDCGPANYLLDPESCTILLATQRNSASIGGGTSNGYATGSTDRVLTHLPFSDGNIYWDYGNATAGSGRLSVSSSGFLATGTVNNWAFVAGKRGREIWRNGVRIASNPSAKALWARGSDGNMFRFGALAGSGSGATNETVFLAALTTEELNENTLRILGENPWLMFRPTERRVWSFLVEGGGPPASEGYLYALDAADSFSSAGVSTPPAASEGALTATESEKDSTVISGAARSTGSIAIGEGTTKDTLVSVAKSTAKGALASADSGVDSFAGQGGSAATAYGVLDATEAGQDTATSGGAVIATGTLAAAEVGADACSALASSTASGILSTTESQVDTFYGYAGVVPASTGYLAAQDGGSDIFAASSAASSTGALSAVEIGQDYFAGGAGVPTTSGTLGATEQTDDFSAFMEALVQGVLTTAEPASDTPYISSGAPKSLGALDVTEPSQDSATAQAKASIAGALASIEAGADMFSGGVSVPKSVGELSASDASSDSASASLGALVSALLSAIESSGDTAAITSEIYAAGMLAGIESGYDRFSARESVPPIDPCRTLFACAEDRTLIAAAQARTLFASAQPRTISVAQKC